jgi:aerobic C4-dicarboxylate transport protein
MEAAPLGAFGAMAFTIGRYGVGSLLSLGKLLFCCYATSITFIVIVLGTICWANGVSLWRFVAIFAKNCSLSSVRPPQSRHYPGSC